MVSRSSPLRTERIFVMTNVELLQLAQTTALGAVTSNASAFATVNLTVAAFAGSGSPDAGWPGFADIFNRELSNYRAAALKDTQAATAAAAPVKPVLSAAAAVAGSQIPAEVFKSLPPEVQERLRRANPGIFPADKPAEVAAGPVAEAAKTSQGSTESRPTVVEEAVAAAPSKAAVSQELAPPKAGPA